MSLYAAIGNFTSASIASAFPLYATLLAFDPPVLIEDLTHLITVCLMSVYENANSSGANLRLGKYAYDGCCQYLEGSSGEYI